MRNVTVAAVQMKCSKSVEKNIAHAEELVRQAAAKGAEIVLLPELFERPYFCQERRYEYYEYAQTAEENPAVRHFSRVAAELGIVIPVSFYEKEVNNTYNSVAVLDADGKNLGVYRKTHIPDDHYYQEKFYFTPGDTGFKVFDTRFGTIGVGICWDQWFPETARCMALQGAELLFYPTAIGSEPILECDSMEHWRRCMQGHAASNLIPVIAANRIGEETVEPCPENGMQKSALNFYGSSFITDQTGEIEKVRITKRGNSGIARNMVLYGKQSSVTIEGQMEIRELLCSPDVVIRKQDGSETSGFDLLPSAYFYITQDKEGNYQLHGGGFGHGVGMSQNGANDLAEAGYGYEEILSHYYNGTELEKLRETGNKTNEE